jgi:hypothetical protein
VRERARREAEAIIIEAHSESRAIGRAAHAERERLVLESRRIEMMLRGALGMIEERAAAVAVAQPSPAPEASATAPALQAAPEPEVAPAHDRGPALPLVGDAPPESWSREDTREFEPIAPIHVEEPPEEGGSDESRTPAAAVLRRLPGSASREFDWGE